MAICASGSTASYVGPYFFRECNSQTLSRLNVDVACPIVSLTTKEWLSLHLLACRSDAQGGVGAVGFHIWAAGIWILAVILFPTVLQKQLKSVPEE